MSSYSSFAPSTPCLIRLYQRPPLATCSPYTPSPSPSPPFLSPSSPFSFQTFAPNPAGSRHVSFAFSSLPRNFLSRLFRLPISARISTAGQDHGSGTPTSPVLLCSIPFSSQTPAVLRLSSGVFVARAIWFQLPPQPYATIQVLLSPASSSTAHQERDPSSGLSL